MQTSVRTKIETKKCLARAGAIRPESTRKDRLAIKRQSRTVVGERLLFERGSELRKGDNWANVVQSGGHIERTTPVSRARLRLVQNAAEGNTSYYNG